MIDFAALLPIYKVFGVPATFALIELAVIDQTGGVEVADIDVKTIRQAVTPRVADLADRIWTRAVSRAPGWCWRSGLESLRSRKPAPAGEAEGEIYLLLVSGTADQMALHRTWKASAERLLARDFNARLRDRLLDGFRP